MWVCSGGKGGCSRGEGFVEGGVVEGVGGCRGGGGL